MHVVQSGMTVPKGKEEQPDWLLRQQNGKLTAALGKAAGFQSA